MFGSSLLGLSTGMRDRLRRDSRHSAVGIGGALRATFGSLPRPTPAAWFTIRLFPSLLPPPVNPVHLVAKTFKMM